MADAIVSYPARGQAPEIYAMRLKQTLSGRDVDMGSRSLGDEMDTSIYGINVPK